MIRTQTLFDQQLALVKERFTDTQYLIANKRKKGNIVNEKFSVYLNLIGILEDNELADFLTDLQKNLILDELIWA